MNRVPRLPVVGCRMATFGRPELLNEAVESFLRQDYPGSKKLFILNDLRGSSYRFEHPEVELENYPERFDTLGEKFNHLISKMDCDIVVNWSDDDIRLPWAISSIVENLQEREVFAGVGYWFMQSGEMNEFIRQHCAGILAYRYHVWAELDGYAAMNSGEDSEFYSRIAARFPVQRTNLAPSDAFFIYRWNTGYGHLSGYPDPVSGYREHGLQAEYRVEKGVIELEPHWTRDYVEIVRRFRARLGDPNEDGG